MTAKTGMKTAGLSGCSFPACPPFSLPTWPLYPRSLCPSGHGVTVPRAGRSRVQHQLPQPAACPIPACRAALRCLAPAPPGGPAASSAFSAEMGERSSHQSPAATHARKLRYCPHRLCSHGSGGTVFFPVGCHCQAARPQTAAGDGDLIISMGTQRVHVCWAALWAGDLDLCPLHEGIPLDSFFPA